MVWKRENERVGWNGGRGVLIFWVRCVDMGKNSI